MARSIWKGTIGFGLVTIGVELFPAEAPERLDLNMLDKRDMSRVGYLKINKTTGKPIEQKDIVRGYEVSSDRYSRPYGRRPEGGESEGDTDAST